MNNEAKNVGAQGNVRIGTQNNYFGVEPKNVSLPNNVPPPVENFVGREEYLKLLLDDYAGGSRCFVLHGIGGVGKTELAKRFAEKIAGDYRARVFVDMLGTGENPYTAEMAMAAVVRLFKPEISADISPDELKRTFTQVIQAQPTLIFLDNAGNKDAVEELQEASICLIVTSREAFTLTNKEGSRRIGQMSTEDAHELLFEFAGKGSFADGEADKLADLAGYLPIALRPLAAILAEDEFETAGRLIAKYSDKKKLLHERVPNYKNLTVDASFELSYEKLSEEIQSRWARLSVFPADFDEAAIAFVLQISEAEAGETQKLLRRLNLLEGNPETRRFSLHDLIREFTDARLSDGNRFQAQFLFAEYYARILITVNRMQQLRESGYYTRALKLIDTDWTNIAAGQKWAAEFIDSDNQIAKLCMYYSGFAQELIHLRLHPQSHVEWMETGLKSTRILNDRRNEANRLVNLGNALFSLAEYQKSTEYYKQAIVIAREIGDRQAEGVSLGNLGNIYDSLGEYQKAIECHNQSLALSRAIGSRQAEGNSLGSLGIAYYNLGEYQKAIDYHEQYRIIACESGDKRSESNSLGGIGLAYNGLDEYQKAIDYHQQALAISCEIGDKRGEGNSLGNLGLVYNRLGEYRKAIDHYKQTLAISRQLDDRQNVGATLYNLGNAYDRLGEKEKACHFWKEALVIYEALESPFVEVTRQMIKGNC